MRSVSSVNGYGLTCRAAARLTVVVAQRNWCVIRSEGYRSRRVGLEVFDRNFDRRWIARYSEPVGGAARILFSRAARDRRVVEGRFELRDFDTRTVDDIHEQGIGARRANARQRAARSEQHE